MNDIRASLQTTLDILRALVEGLEVMTRDYQIPTVSEMSTDEDFIAVVNLLGERMNAFSAIALPQVPTTDDDLEPAMEAIAAEIDDVRQQAEAAQFNLKPEADEPDRLIVDEIWWANVDSSNGDGTYEVSEVAQDSGAWEAVTHGRSGTAQEANLSEDVPTDSVVRVEQMVGADGEAVLVFPFNNIATETAVYFDGCCRIDEANPTTAYADTRTMANDEAAGNEERLLLHLAEPVPGNKAFYIFLRHALSMTFGGNSGGPKWKIEVRAITEDFDWEGTGAGAPTWNAQPTIDNTNYYAFSGAVYPYEISNHSFVASDTLDVEILDHALHPAWFTVQGSGFPGLTVYGIEIRITNFTGHNGGSWDITTQLTYNPPAAGMMLKGA